MSRFLSIIALALLIGGLTGLQSRASDPVPERSANASDTLDINGYLRTTVEYETDAIAGDDLDLATYLWLDANHTQKPGFSLHFYGRTRFDLDNDATADGGMDLRQKPIV